MTKAFVVGWPIAHSRSPLIHGFWLKRHGIAGTYERIAVPPEEFARFIAGLPASGFAGGNVTLPHKEAALPLLDRYNFGPVVDGDVLPAHPFDPAASALSADIPLIVTVCVSSAVIVTGLLAADSL